MGLSRSRRILSALLTAALVVGVSAAQASAQTAPELQDKTQRNPELRLSVIWNWGH
jgi:hypothetical protein